MRDLTNPDLAADNGSASSDSSHRTPIFNLSITDNCPIRFNTLCSRVGRSFPASRGDSETITPQRSPRNRESMKPREVRIPRWPSSGSARLEAPFPPGKAEKRTRRRVNPEIVKRALDRSILRSDPSTLFSLPRRFRLSARRSLHAQFGALYDQLRGRRFSDT